MKAKPLLSLWAALGDDGSLSHGAFLHFPPTVCRHAQFVLANHFPLCRAALRACAPLTPLPLWAFALVRPAHAHAHALSVTLPSTRLSVKSVMSSALPMHCVAAFLPRIPLTPLLNTHCTATSNTNTKHHHHHFCAPTPAARVTGSYDLRGVGNSKRQTPEEYHRRAQALKSALQSAEDSGLTSPPYTET